MHPFSFYLIILISFFLLPDVAPTFIEDNEAQHSLSANPIVVEKLLEKLSKYQNKIVSAKDNMVRKEDLFENRKNVQKNSEYLNFLITVCYRMNKKIRIFLENLDKNLNLIYFQHQKKKE